jgi:hypothetical protein
MRLAAAELTEAHPILSKRAMKSSWPPSCTVFQQSEDHEGSAAHSCCVGRLPLAQANFLSWSRFVAAKKSAE